MNQYLKYILLIILGIILFTLINNKENFSIGNQLFVVDKVIKRDKKDTIVLSHIEHATAPPLRIDWRLRDRGKGPKIIDIAIEGVSLLATKRADFSSTIKKGGIHGLINDLEEKNTQNN